MIAKAYNFAKKGLHGERRLFSEKVNGNARRIALSNILKKVANPIIVTFLNAFVWRISDSVTSVAIYNIAFFLALPFAFYLNGVLLRSLHIRHLFAWGAMLLGAASTAFVFFGSSDKLHIFLYGIVWGFGSGIYWANRNYLEFQETFAEMRLYFYGFLRSISSVIDVLVPIIVGWFIAFGSFFNLYSQRHAYWLIFTLSFILMFFSGRVILQGRFDSPRPKRIILQGLGYFSRRRILNLIYGFYDGVYFISTILILLVLGNEGVLGTVTGGVSLLTAILLYFYGRREVKKQGWFSLIWPSLFMLVASLLLLLLPIKLGVIVYVILYGIGATFINVIAWTVLLSLSDKDLAKKPDARYSLIVDNEIFLNSGRIVGILALVALTFYYPTINALIYGQLGIIIIYFILLSLFLLFNRKMWHPEKSR